jgi:hypothetical protein
MNGGCAQGQSAIGDGGGPGGGVSVSRAQPRIGGGVASSQAGAVPGQGSQGSTLVSRGGLADGVRGGCIDGGLGGRGGTTERARASPYPGNALLSSSWLMRMAIARCSSAVRSGSMI